MKKSSFVTTLILTVMLVSLFAVSVSAAGGQLTDCISCRGWCFGPDGLNDGNGGILGKGTTSPVQWNGQCSFKVNSTNTNSSFKFYLIPPLFTKFTKTLTSSQYAQAKLDCAAADVATYVNKTCPLATPTPTATKTPTPTATSIPPTSTPTNTPTATPTNTPTPPAPICGDGLVNQPGEQCDDGNLIGGDGCSTTCQIEKCGDGLLQPNGADGIPNNADDEECDDGYNVANDGCSPTCKIEKCGDGIIQPPETCDGAAPNACGANPCLPPNVFGECTCPPLPPTSTPTATPTNTQVPPTATPTNTAVPPTETPTDTPVPTATEVPPTPTETPTPTPTFNCAKPCLIDVDCIFPGANGTTTNGTNFTSITYCGTCDTNTLTCNGQPQMGKCGDGTVDPGEQCDDKNFNNCDGCNMNCQNEICGDNIVCAPEACDDGNKVDGDACDNTCNPNNCGDGKVQPLLGETCDDPAVPGCPANFFCVAPAQPGQCTCKPNPQENTPTPTPTATVTATVTPTQCSQPCGPAGSVGPGNGCSTGETCGPDMCSCHVQECGNDAIEYPEDCDGTAPNDCAFGCNEDECVCLTPTATPTNTPVPPATNTPNPTSTPTCVPAAALASVIDCRGRCHPTDPNTVIVIPHIVTATVGPTDCIGCASRSNSDCTAALQAQCFVDELVVPASISFTCVEGPGSVNCPTPTNCETPTPTATATSTPVPPTPTNTPHPCDMSCLPLNTCINGGVADFGTTCGPGTVCCNPAPTETPVPTATPTPTATATEVPPTNTPVHCTKSCLPIIDCDTVVEQGTDCATGYCCDPKPTDTPVPPTATPTPACGNNIIESGEECDTGSGCTGDQICISCKCVSPTNTPTVTPTNTPVPPTDTPVPPTDTPTPTSCNEGPCPTATPPSGPTSTPVAAPVNNNIAGASPAGSPPFSTTYGTAGANLESGESNACASIGATTWETLTGSGSRTVTLSGYDTVLGIYSGPAGATSFAQLTPIVCNDDSTPPGSFGSRATFTAVSGTTYYIQAGGFLGASGTLTKTVT